MAESDGPDVPPAVTSRQRHRRLIILACVAIVVLAIIGILFWRHEADLSARRAQAQAQVDLITKQIAHIQDANNKYTKLIAAYNSAFDDARKAGHKRHDSSDDDVARVQAKKELADVVSMQTMSSSMTSSLESVADAFADVLGGGPVASSRSTADQAVQMASLGLNRWWRAIEDIVDGLTKDVPSSENIEQLYDESDDYITRATTLDHELLRQWAELRKQVRARADQAKHELDAIR